MLNARTAQDDAFREFGQSLKRFLSAKGEYRTTYAESRGLCPEALDHVLNGRFVTEPGLGLRPPMSREDMEGLVKDLCGDHGAKGALMRLLDKISPPGDMN